MQSFMFIESLVLEILQDICIFAKICEKMMTFQKYDDVIKKVVISA